MSRNYELRIDSTPVSRASQLAFRDTCFLLGREFSKVMTEVRFWPGLGMRDIVDLGRLRSSQQLVFLASLFAEFNWPLEYAVYVYEGYTLKSGRSIPGRPWIEVALQDFDPQAVFAQRLKFYLGR